MALMRGRRCSAINPVAEDVSGKHNDLGDKIQMGRKINRSPNTYEEITSGIGFEVEGVGDTRAGRRARPVGERQGKDEGTCPLLEQSAAALIQTPRGGANWIGSSLRDGSRAGFYFRLGSPVGPGPGSARGFESGLSGGPKPSFHQ